MIKIKRKFEEVRSDLDPDATEAATETIADDDPEAKTTRSSPPRKRRGARKLTVDVELAALGEKEIAEFQEALETKNLYARQDKETETESETETETETTETEGKSHSIWKVFILKSQNILEIFSEIEKEFNFVISSKSLKRYEVTYRLQTITIYARKSVRDLAHQLEKQVTTAHPKVDLLRDKHKIILRHPDMDRILEEVNECFNIKQIDPSRFRLLPEHVDPLVALMEELLLLGGGGDDDEE
jgi:hypothetical protein